ncbi:hypothetical protein NMP99_01245 [Glutamicibacter mishrai]|uniref:hypothetical protein n=1 Tax=Glutamicibacter mishrai TaxID=1775880 RepID=UPI0020CEB2B5|nr:hypothetical protein [Glutamicibacter mishrai]UTT39965.1 hypothetical protein NMP99_01245 [Glutamicibacter mishrai]
MNEDNPPVKKKLQLNGPESERNGILVSRIMLVTAILSAVLAVAGLVIIPFGTVLEDVGRRNANLGTYAFVIFPIGAFILFRQVRKGAIENRTKGDDAKTSIAMLNTGTVFTCLIATMFILSQLAFMYGFAEAAGLI